MSPPSTPRRRREPLRARPGTDTEPDSDTGDAAAVALPADTSAALERPAPSPDERLPVPAPTRSRRLPSLFGGRRGLLATAGQLTSAAAAASREVAANTADVTREVVQQAADRQPATAISTTLFNGFVQGAVRAADAVEAETGIDLAASAANALFQGDDGRDRDATNRAMARAMSALGQAATGAGHVGDELLHLGGTANQARQELRRLGRDLLLRSSQLDDPDEHPAFRTILHQISPDEARIICFLAQAGPQPIVGLLEIDRMKKSSREVARNVSLIGQEAGCIRPHLASIYLDNLDRLGIVFVRDFRTGTQEQYDLLYAQPEIDNAEPPGRRFVKHQVVDRSVELSTFGRQLYDMSFTEPVDDTTSDRPDGPDGPDGSGDAA